MVRELVEEAEKAGFKTPKRGEVYAGRRTPPGQFLRSWGGDALREDPKHTASKAGEKGA